MAPGKACVTEHFDASDLAGVGASLAHSLPGLFLCSAFGAMCQRPQRPTSHDQVNLEIGSGTLGSLDIQLGSPPRPLGVSGHRPLISIY